MTKGHNSHKSEQSMTVIKHDLVMAQQPEFYVNIFEIEEVVHVNKIVPADKQNPFFTAVGEGEVEVGGWGGGGGKNLHWGLYELKHQPNDLCAKPRLRSAWASTQSNQCLYWVLNR